MLSFIQDVNLLVMALDQGSVGCAGVAFAEDAMDAMVHSKWDKFHRVVRDCKLSFQHACQGPHFMNLSINSFILLTKSYIFSGARR